MKDALTVGGLRAAPGTKASGYVTVPGTGCRFPVTLVNGVREGRLLLATAGIHGCEYPGILALTELARELNPGELSGGVILIPVVNLSGFLLRQPYVMPADEDRKNLNRLFPTDGSGTLADRLCQYLMEEFVSRCDFHVDLHSGDIVEDLEAFAMVSNIPDPEKRAFLTDVVQHTAFPWRMQSGGRREFYNGSALTYGVPSLLFERGGAGTCLRADVEENKSDLRRVMQCLKILPGEAPRNESQQFFDRHEWTEAQPGDEGLLIPFVRLGDDIRKGQKLFEIRDVFGNPIREILAEFDGHVVIQSRTLSVHPGDDLITYGRIQQ